MISDAIRNAITNGEIKYFPNAFSHILSWEELESLLNLRPFLNNKRLFLITPETYTWYNQEWLTDIDTYPAAVLAEALKKHMCFIIDASRVNQNINNICQELENIFVSSAADAHIYFTVADELDQGFGIHWDYSHNLIIQTEGETKFKVWDKTGESMRLDSIPEEPLIDVVMKPGDAICIPRLYYHQAISLTKRLSVSFPINVNANLPSQDRTWIKFGTIA